MNMILKRIQMFEVSCKCLSQIMIILRQFHEIVSNRNSPRCGRTYRLIHNNPYLPIQENFQYT